MHEYLFSIFPNEKFIDLGLYQYGWERCTPAHQFGPAARTHYLFHYVISGTGLLMAQDQKGETRNYSIKSGQGFLLYPGQISTYIADKTNPWEYTWLEFDGLRVKPALSTGKRSAGYCRFFKRPADLSCHLKGIPGNHDERNALYCQSPR